MPREIKIQLSDEQYAALVQSAEAANEKFYAHCRRLLFARLTTAMPMTVRQDMPRQTLPAAAAQVVSREEPDRLGRLEEMVANLAANVQMLIDPTARPEPVGDEAQYDEEAPHIDVDAMVENTLADAERAGLAQPPAASAARPAGVRSLHRPVMPFTKGGHPLERAGFGGG